MSPPLFVPAAARRTSGALDISGCILVVPALGLATVSQLALDILVAAAERLGALYSQSIANVVGAATHAGEDLAVSLELYSVPGTRVCLLQQRAVPVGGRQEAWVAELTAWAAAQGVARLLVLGAAEAGGREDMLLDEAAGRGAWLVHVSGEDGKAASFLPGGEEGVRVWPAVEVPQEAARPGMSPSAAKAHLLAVAAFGSLTGLGLAPLYSRSAAGLVPALPVATLFAFACEGDNRDDALALARTAAVTALGLPSSFAQNLAFPSWWESGLEGPTFDQNLFG
jgi:hypothetical protein